MDSLLGTINGFASVASISGIPENLLGTTAGKVLHNVGKAWTRIKGQRSLRDAVSVVSGPDGAVRILARGITEIYECDDLETCNRPQSKLLASLNDQEWLMRDLEAGKQSIGLYEAIVREDRLENYYAALRQKFPEDMAKHGFCVSLSDRMDRKNCVPDEDLQSIAALHSILAVLEPNHLMWRERKREAEEWKRTRQAKAQANRFGGRRLGSGARQDRRRTPPMLRFPRHAFELWRVERREAKERRGPGFAGIRRELE